MIDEGVIKFEARWRESPPLALPEITELLEWRKPLFDAGLIGHLAAFDVGYGNLSARVGDSDRFVISGSQTGHIARPDARHFALVTRFSVDANSVDSVGPVTASSESLTHAAIYALSASIRAVVHVHSEELWVGLASSLASTREGIAYGTPHMALEFARLYDETSFAESGVARMAGHEGGLISFGISVQQAAERILALGNREPG
ncbi:MAG: class II aldolase/adducin family protein [Gammaproteobacteria bacterium]|nr:class II aldolase/adducin family protein [Gammaproteobacteria bacterium]